MDGWQQLISNIVTAALWPVAVLALGVIFRDTLRSVVARITKLEAFGANIEIGESVKQLDAAADKVQIEAASKPKVEDAGSSTTFVGKDLPLRHLVEVTRISPAAAIVDAWREVEIALLEYWGSVNKLIDAPADRYTQIGRIVERLIQSKMISRQQANLLTGLRKTRNSVAHGQSQPSEGHSLAYIDSAGLAIQTLLTDKWAVERGEHGMPPL